jgi:glycerate 2-kinase
VACAGFHTRGQGIARPGPYRVVVAPDSFKGSLDARAVAAAIGAGVRDAIPDAVVVERPVADGGEGLLDVLLPALGGEKRITSVCGPLPGQTVEAAWGYVAGERLAIIEMARAAGLTLVPPERRDPRITTTYGFGELIVAALDAGAERVLVGIGGTATNDGGAGMAEALGVRFLDQDGNRIGRGGASLCGLARIDTSGSDGRMARTSVVVASDVGNPLTGPEGASAVYGPQKGATPAMVEELDRCMERYRQVIREQAGVDVQTIRGSGAAGGAGAALAVFCKAQMRSGIDVVLDAIGFEKCLEGADLVITGEGRLDAQTKSGKALDGILRRARASGVPVAAVVGSMEGDRRSYVRTDAFCDVIGLVDEQTSIAEAIAGAPLLLRRRAETLVRRILQNRTAASTTELR